MKKLSIIFGLLFCFGKLQAQSWHTQKLDEFVSISFPGKPEFTDTLGQKYFVYQNKLGQYLVSVVNIGDRPDLQIKGGALGRFYDEIVSGAVETSKGKVLGQRMFEVAGLKGAEIEFTSTADPKMPNLIFKRVLFFNNSVYTIDFWTNSVNVEFTKTDKEKYFNSFTISKGEEPLRQYTTESTAVKLKKKLIKHAFPIFATLSLAIFLFFVFRKKKK